MTTAATPALRAAEHAHYRLKDAIDQALILLGSRDFDTPADYASFVRQMVERRNRLAEGKLEQEMLCLRSLPPAPVPEYVNYQSKVPEAPLLTLSGQPDLKIYDRLLTVSLVAAGVCA